MGSMLSEGYPNTLLGKCICGHGSCSHRWRRSHNLLAGMHLYKSLGGTFPLFHSRCLCNTREQPPLCCIDPCRQTQFRLGTNMQHSWRGWCLWRHTLVRGNRGYSQHRGSDIEHWCRPVWKDSRHQHDIQVQSVFWLKRGKIKSCIKNKNICVNTRVLSYFHSN